MTCTYLNNSRTRSAVQSPLSSPGWGQVDSDRLGYDGPGRTITKRWLGSQLNEQEGYDCTWPYCGFTAAYDHASNKLYERHLHAESRSHLYPDQDSLDRLREYQRGTLQQDSQTGAVSVATPISLPGTDQQRTYDLDGLGNWRRTAHTPVGGSQATEVRQQNYVNQLTRYGTTPVAYDHGNNAADPDPDAARRGSGNVTDDGVRLYKYDAFNRLIEVRRKSDSAVIGTYVYDALGRRIVKTVSNGGLPGNLPNVATVYLYAGPQCVEERDSAENALRQYVWGRYIDELVQQKELVGQSPPTYYPMSDLLYRTIALRDPQQLIVEVYDYDAYGNTLIYNQAGGDWFQDEDYLACPQDPKCRFLFTGREYDAELSDAASQIYFYRARYYSPQMGRFLSRDRITNAGGQYAYSYASSRPCVRIDPLGLRDQRWTKEDTEKVYKAMTSRDWEVYEAGRQANPGLCLPQVVDKVDNETAQAKWERDLDLAKAKKDADEKERKRFRGTDWLKGYDRCLKNVVEEFDSCCTAANIVALAVGAWNVLAGVGARAIGIKGCKSDRDSGMAYCMKMRDWIKNGCNAPRPANPYLIGDPWLE